MEQVTAALRPEHACPYLGEGVFEKWGVAVASTSKDYRFFIVNDFRGRFIAFAKKRGELLKYTSFLAFACISRATYFPDTKEFTLVFEKKGPGGELRHVVVTGTVEEIASWLARSDFAGYRRRLPLMLLLLLRVLVRSKTWRVTVLPSRRT